MNCLLGPTVPDEGRCRAVLSDVRPGDTLLLLARTNPGSTFTGWSGCSSTRGAECELSFAAGAPPAVFNVTASFDVDPANVCNTTFGTGAGYILCEESPTSCTFYTRLDDIDSCNTRCASFGSTCLGSIRDAADSCTPGEAGFCDDVVGDRLCMCAKL